MNKKSLGYIASHPFWEDSYLPQRIQNNLIRMYCENINYSLIWSIPEVSIGYKSTPFLNDFLNSNKDEIDAVIFISYQMNHPLSIIKSISEILNKSIEEHFVIENTVVKNFNEFKNLKMEINLSYLQSSNKKSPFLLH